MNYLFKAAPKINYHKRIKRLSLLLLMIMISACEVGPNYVRPSVAVPSKFKEADKGWKIAQPQDTMDRGQWWCLFNDPELNSLETQLNNCNQTIAEAAANYLQASALVDEARASYFPTITGSATLTRQKEVVIGSSSSSNAVASSTSGSNSTSALGGSGSVGSSGGTTFYSHSLLLDGTWEPDLWGSVRRSVEAASAGAQSSAALLANTRLSEQATLAQDYFELRGVDTDQKLLDDTVNADKKLLQLTLNNYNAGVDGRADVVQAQTQLESAQAAAINNGINRALYEHAIAVLIGVPPADFSLNFYPLKANTTPPNIPIEIPSQMLERRPDVAQAERLVAQANAQIGVAIAAYFPTLTLTGTGDMQGTGLGHWFSLPDLSWSVGSEMAETLFDGGLRSAVTAAARATYMSNVASYRQTVLAAFQDVEDNLASLRILNNEMIAQDQAAASSEQAVKLVVNEYKAGTAAYSDVVAAMIIAFADQKAADDVNYLRMTTAVGLVKALGGGWNADELDTAKS